MSARGRPRGLRLRHVYSSTRQQRRLLNHFISKGTSAPSPPPPPPPSFRFTLAVKDNIATTSSSTSTSTSPSSTSPTPQQPTTTCASPFLTTYHSPFEATIVSQLRARGARLVGKTNLDEFGMGSHSTHSAFGAVAQEDRRPDPNPNSNSSHDGLLSAGGSSGGSAVAVAAGAADVALGTDTGGSVRLPAAYCGVVGFKPSYGMLSRFGVVPYANSLDTFGIPLEYNIEELEPSIRDGWARAAKVLQDEFGARVVPVSLPSTRHALSAYYVIAPAEASSNLAKYDGVRYGTRDSEAASDAAGGVLYAASRGKGFGDEVKRRILLGSYTLSSEAMDNYFIQAQRVRRLVRRDFNRVFALDNPLHERETFDLTDLDESIVMEDKWGPEEVDFLLCPTAPTLAPRLEDVMSQTPVDAYMNDVFTVPASLAGLPAISIPMPVASDRAGDAAATTGTAGLQLIGQYWDDARLLAVADAVSAALQNSSPVR
ncbi:hypothetical protein NEMBOFW57_001720 [Staphylotrichum longicolle]|uniref:Glutamyl-tRNA(Gln) amidotransferase subunit A, mitochondrial n=1 Tax=Staphylotrichum longicolle TaxID=669026 RepID=A0AAD4F1Q4_9PEZI|nr:hypothetical protein NEMBOFW57_001720 [Staphylotrichum longicolle]